MFRSVVRPAAIALMLWYMAGVPIADAFGASLELVEFEGASQPIGSLQQRLGFTHSRRAEQSQNWPYISQASDKAHSEFLGCPPAVGCLT